MRIVGGELKGRVLLCPSGRATRPTSDRVREGLASALAARDAFAGARVLDLFAGSGALGFEALSRGALWLLSLESDPRALRCIAQNARALGVSQRMRARRLDLLGPPAQLAERVAALSEAPWTLVFADPPYAAVRQLLPLLAALGARGLFAEGAVLALEHPRRENLEPPANFAHEAAYRYGDTGVSLWRWVALP